MDPIAVSLSFAAILASISSLTLNTLELLRRAKKSSSDLQSQLDEIEVVRDVLEECYGIIQASQNTKIPPSVERAVRICEKRYAQLEESFRTVLDMHLASKSRVRRLGVVKTLMMTENERKAAFKGFRSVVLLLRDLCSEIRLQQQLVNMSAGLAELLADRYEEAASYSDDAPQPRHIYIGKEDNDNKEDQQKQQPPTGSPQNRVKGGVGQEFKELIKQDFTRNVTLVVDTGAGTLSERKIYAHARAKMDTGCREKLITLEMFERAEMDKSLLVELPEEDQVDLEMLEGARCTILYMVHLFWYQDGDMKMRHADFLVVKSGPFDILLGSHRIAQDLGGDGHSVLLAGKKKKKKKADRKVEKEDHAKHLEEQRVQEIQERNAQRAQAALQKLRAQGTAQVPVQALGPAPSQPPVPAPPHHQAQTQASSQAPTAAQTLIQAQALQSAAPQAAAPQAHQVQAPQPPVIQPQVPQAQLATTAPHLPSSSAASQATVAPPQQIQPQVCPSPTGTSLPTSMTGLSTNTSGSNTASGSTPSQLNPPSLSSQQSIQTGQLPPSTQMAPSAKKSRRQALAGLFKR